LLRLFQHITLFHQRFTSLGHLNGRKMSYISYFWANGNYVCKYEDVGAFLMEIEDGRFQETFKRLFSTFDDFIRYDFRRFENHTALIDEFENKYDVDRRGAWYCVALLLETDPIAATISRVDLPCVEALITKSEFDLTQESLPQGGENDSLLDGNTQDHIDPTGVMPNKTIHLFRHAESEHQRGGEILDPFLTVLGIHQARSITSERYEDMVIHFYTST